VKSDGTQVYATARDAGNYSAGYIAGINDLSWGAARAGFDGLELLKSGNFEGMQSTSAQKLGHNKGYPIGEAKRIEREWKKATSPWPTGPKW